MTWKGCLAKSFDMTNRERRRIIFHSSDLLGNALVLSFGMPILIFIYSGYRLFCPGNIFMEGRKDNVDCV